MTLSINVPDNIAAQVVDNICAATQYDAASGKTKQQWAKEAVIARIKALNSQGAMMNARKSQAAIESQLT